MENDNLITTARLRTTVGIMEQEHQSDHTLDLVWVFDGGFDLSNAGIITLMPYI